MEKQYRLIKLERSSDDYPKGYIVKLIVPAYRFQAVKNYIEDLDYVFEVTQCNQVMTVYFDLFQDTDFCFQSLETEVHRLTQL